MYACVHEPGAGFFGGVGRLEDRPLTLRDLRRELRTPLPGLLRYAIARRAGGHGSLSIHRRCYHALRSLVKEVA
jgi:hypothetical protein